MNGLSTCQILENRIGVDIEHNGINISCVPRVMYECTHYLEQYCQYTVNRSDDAKVNVLLVLHHVDTSLYK